MILQPFLHLACNQVEGGGLTEHVMFWLFVGIATVVRRAEGSPSPLSTHGGSIDFNF